MLSAQDIDLIAKLEAETKKHRLTQPCYLFQL